MFCIGFMLLMIGAAGMDSPNQTPAIGICIVGLVLMALDVKFKRIKYIAKRLWRAVEKEARNI